MEKGKLYEEVLQEMGFSIDKVISGEVKKVILWGVSQTLVEKYLQDKHNININWDTYSANGWQVDWNVKTNGKKFQLNGDLQDAEITLSINEKEKED